MAFDRTRRRACALRLARSRLRGSLARDSADLAGPRPPTASGTPGADPPATGARRRRRVPATVKTLLKSSKADRRNRRASLADERAPPSGRASDLRRRTVRCGFRGQSGHCQGSAAPRPMRLRPMRRCTARWPDSLQGARPVAAREPAGPQVTALAGRCESGGVPGGFHGREPADGPPISWRRATPIFPPSAMPPRPRRPRPPPPSIPSRTITRRMWRRGSPRWQSRPRSMADALSGVSDDLKGVGGELSASATSAADVMARHRRQDSRDHATKLQGRLLGAAGDGLRYRRRHRLGRPRRPAAPMLGSDDAGPFEGAGARPWASSASPVFPVENFG